MPKLHGTPEQRRAQKAEIRRQRSLNWGRTQGELAKWSGHELLRQSCQRAKAVAHDLTESGQRLLAAAIIQAVETVDIPQNRRHVS